MDISSVRNHSLVGTKRIIAKFKLKFKVKGVIRTVSTDFAGRSGLFVPPMKPGAPPTGSSGAPVSGCRGQKIANMSTVTNLVADNFGLSDRFCAQCRQPDA